MNRTHGLVPAAFLAALCAGAAAQSTFTVLEPFQFWPTAISGDGRTVVGRLTNTPSWWTASSGLQPVSATLGKGNATAVSDDGSVIVGYETLVGVGSHPWRWTAATGVQYLPNLPGNILGQSVDVSGDGSVVVGYSAQNGGDQCQPWRWTEAGGVQALPLVGSDSRQAVAVSNDGQLILGRVVAPPLGQGVLGWIWSESQGYQYLVPPTGMNVVGPMAMSGDGSTSGGRAYSMSGTPVGGGFLWSGVLPTQALGTLPGFSSSQVSVLSWDGAIVAGQVGRTIGSPEGYIWTATTGMRDLRAFFAGYGVTEPLTWSAMNPLGISHDGRVFLGRGVIPSGVVAKGWLVHFDPTCYADCNADWALNLSDFGCFQTQFALGDLKADCDGDAILTLSDFGCFQTRFLIGCP